MALLHIAHAEDWRAAVPRGEYRVSTRGASLDEVGFIHASSSAQVAGVADFAYADDPEPLVVLVVDDATVREASVVVRYQDAGNGTLYPHIFGALRPEFVTEVREAAFIDGRFCWARPGGAVAFKGSILETDVAGAVGSSGRLWQRGELLAAIGGFASSEGLVVSGLAASVPAEGLVLVTYTSTQGSSVSRRSSLWRSTPRDWQIEFHQGTPA